MSTIKSTYDDGKTWVTTYDVQESKGELMYIEMLAGAQAYFNNWQDRVFLPNPNLILMYPPSYGQNNFFRIDLNT